MNKKHKFLTARPSSWDIAFLSLFLFGITFQPTLFVHEIIYLDQGLYLPAIRAIFEGQIPFRDFMLYRGPLEVYVPAAMMKLFGDNMIWLPVFFFAGTVVNMWLAILIAYRLFRSRFILYLFVPVLIARTFPRISFYYWGGLRYALGMGALYLIIRFLQTKKTSRLVLAGVLTALGFLTTIESGVTSLAAIGTGLCAAVFFNVIDGALFRKAVLKYFLGFLLVIAPYGLFLWQTHSLWPYIEATFVVPLRMTSSFLIIGTHIPSGFWHFIASLAPGSPYFKVLSPVYFYMIFLAFLIFYARNIARDWVLAALMSIGVYALILYLASFRAIWGHHFEMALQPQKILYFFMIEEALFFLMLVMTPLIKKMRDGASEGKELLKQGALLFFMGFIIFGVMASSLGYSMKRYSRHFPVYKKLLDRLKGREPRDYSFLKDVEKRLLNIPRAKGMVVPKWQADDIEEVVRYIETNSAGGEPVLTYPELGNFNYWFNRPFVGRFPIATLSWAIEEWHQEYMSDIRTVRPRYAIMTNLRHKTFPWMLYFKFPGNISKFKDVTGYVLDNYAPVLKLSSVTIYKRRN